ncbi:glutaredoxin family protein [Autumnicola psychrophila]|uniref:Glutaredoxin family protein n=1 Tax=Autumnicola psychrophila TaxID=3075592 RepID=A0ABU3DS27_9FLAO|nr:glutaredoxin family protein [Zunongwangia sp. F225]MDT0685887.1 glutaredoxin family protein [Zunongwangia sp. F225]
MKPLTIVIFFLFFTHIGSSQENVSKGFSEHQSVINSLAIYGSSDCHYCQDTKAYLQEKNIPFKFYDIYENQKNMQEMLLKLKKSGMSLNNIRLPVVVRSDKLLMNSTDFESFLNELTKE